MPPVLIALLLAAPAQPLSRVVDYEPAWSPDGSRIAFVSLRDGNPEIYVVSAQGGPATRLTNHPGLDLHPQWSPDGSRLLWNTSRRSANVDEPDTIELWTMAADGSAPAPLVSGGIATYASWSPDGQHLLYRRQQPDGNSEIMVAEVDGKAHRNVSQDPAFDGWPAWSRDGRHVDFAREEGEAAGLWLVPASGGAAKRLATPPGRCTNPRWSPTADQVVFSCRGERQVRLYLLDLPEQP